MAATEPDPRENIANTDAQETYAAWQVFDSTGDVIPLLRQSIKGERECNEARAWNEESKASGHELATRYDALLKAVVNLRDCKGRHHTQIAAHELFALIPDWVDTDWKGDKR